MCAKLKSKYIDVLWTGVCTVVKERQIYDMREGEENAGRFEFKVSVWSNDIKSNRSMQMTTQFKWANLAPQYYLLKEPELLAEMADSEHGTGKAQDEPRITSCVREQKDNQILMGTGQRDKEDFSFHQW